MDSVWFFCMIALEGILNEGWGTCDTIEKQGHCRQHSLGLLNFAGKWDCPFSCSGSPVEVEHGRFCGLIGQGTRRSTPTGCATKQVHPIPSDCNDVWGVQLIQNLAATSNNQKTACATTSFPSEWSSTPCTDQHSQCHSWSDCIDPPQRASVTPV